VGKTFVVENLRPGDTMLCLVCGQHRHSRKILNSKTFVVSKNLQKPLYVAMLGGKKFVAL